MRRPHHPHVAEHVGGEFHLDALGRLAAPARGDGRVVDQDVERSGPPLGEGEDLRLRDTSTISVRRRAPATDFSISPAPAGRARGCGTPSPPRMAFGQALADRRPRWRRWRRSRWPPSAAVRSWLTPPARRSCGRRSCRCRAGPRCPAPGWRCSASCRQMAVLEQPGESICPTSSGPCRTGFSARNEMIVQVFWFWAGRRRVVLPQVHGEGRCPCTRDLGNLAAAAPGTRPRPKS